MASFCKVLFGCMKLRIPPTFVRRHLQSLIPATVTLLGHANRRFLVTITNLGGAYFFTDGWDSFATANELLHGEFLVFKLLDTNTFEVSPYGVNGLLKHGLGNGGVVLPIPGTPNIEEGLYSGTQRVWREGASQSSHVQTPNRVWKAEHRAAVAPLHKGNNSFEVVITDSYVKKPICMSRSSL